MSEEGYELRGTFYTKKEGSINGIARVVGKRWHITKNNGETLTKTVIFLDRQKKVPAPKSDNDRDDGKDFVRSLITKYEAELESCGNSGYKEVAPSYAMEIRIASSYVHEYKKIYANYFRSNAVKFILDD
jgi:hypothetical protein